MTVAIRGLEDAAGLERSLRAAGVPAVVDYAAGRKHRLRDAPAAPRRPHGNGHQPIRPSRRRAEPLRAGTQAGRPRDDGAGQPQRGRVKFSIDPGTLRPSEKVYITTSTGALSSIGMAIAKEKPAAPCR